MESMSALPSDPAADLDAADAARARLTSSLRLPSGFHVLLALATAVQIGTAAFGLSELGGPRLWWVVGGLAFFSLVCAWLLMRFRRLNGVKVDGLLKKALLGTSLRSGIIDVVASVAALGAALAGLWWLMVLAAVAGGILYAVSARLWWRDYLADPAAHVR